MIESAAINDVRNNDQCRYSIIIACSPNVNDGS